MLSPTVWGVRGSVHDRAIYEGGCIFRCTLLDGSGVCLWVPEGKTAAADSVFGGRACMALNAEVITSKKSNFTGLDARARLFRHRQLRCVVEQRIRKVKEFKIVAEISRHHHIEDQALTEMVFCRLTERIQRVRNSYMRTEDFFRRGDMEAWEELMMARIMQEYDEVAEW